ncbi:LysR family transcriptional regulator [Vibrio hangzhouensis]|uniref:Transcriptional regulator, LysR family n=1 Tax=Vibrio hangzhouensis TaxID=462991 RepID=A0A1H5SBU7_9VIBR|nr:LysR family transcriptional regulator [Vibrio hangzhouensis]SEF48049.1 transcriptional regulator, LysR family [Vibrio hangzhouensis]
MNFDWNHAKAFIVTAELGSLTSAAVKLSSTQPTIGRQVQAFEDELGVVLFERTGNKLLLTETGQVIYEILRPMMGVAMEASLAAHGNVHTMTGRVVIAASQIDALYRLPEILKKVSELEPGLRVDVEVSNQVSDLLAHEADIAIRSFRPEQNELIARKIKTIPVWLYASSTYAEHLNLADDQGGGSAAMRKARVLGFKDNTQVISILNQSGWQLTEENITTSCDFQPLQIELAIRGMGCVFLPQDIGDNHTQLVRVFEPLGPPVEIPMWLVCHRELNRSAKVRRVYDLLIEALLEEGSRAQK